MSKEKISLSGKLRGKLFILVATLFFAAMPVRVEALIACDGDPSSSVPAAAQYTAFKIYLDDIRLPHDYQDSDLLNHVLHWRLAQRFDNTDLASLNAKVIRCNGRWPEGAHEIAGPVAERLNDANVVMEIWGFYFDDLAGFSFALYPIMSSASIGWPDLPQPDLLIRDSYQNLGGQSEAEYLKSLMKQSPNVPAYAAIAVGLRALILRDYDRALGNLCSAHQMLRQIPFDPAGSSPIPTLTKFVAAMTQVTVENAIAARGDNGDAASAGEPARRYEGKIGTTEIPPDAPCGPPP